MRSMLSAVVALLVATTAASAQQMVVGPYAGVTIATLGGADVEDAQSRTGLAAGVHLDKRFGENGFFRTGLGYASRGAETSEDGTTVRFKVNYIEVPALLGYRFPTSGSMRPYLAGGAQVGFKAGCSLEGEDGGTSVSFDCDEADLEVKSADFSLVANAGLVFAAGRGEVVVDTRYTHGLSNIQDDSTVKNRGFTFSLGYIIPLGQ